MELEKYYDSLLCENICIWHHQLPDPIGKQYKDNIELLVAISSSNNIEILTKSLCSIK